MNDTIIYQLESDSLILDKHSGSCNKCELKETKKRACADAYNVGYVQNPAQRITKTSCCELRDITERSEQDE